jgi:hypothetical protein
MKIREKISIEEFDRKLFQVELAGPYEERKAVLTHYLKIIQNRVSRH